ncbi:hypothetical protein F1880_004616 [Penicillium rolfsii]|nr:hypothetical protein F1880_004616 [Penicillium rolfsii]
MVATPDEPGVRGTGVMAGEATVNVRGAFGRLADPSESSFRNLTRAQHPLMRALTLIITKRAPAPYAPAKSTVA